MMNPKTFYRGARRARASDRLLKTFHGGLKSRREIRRHFSTNGAGRGLDKLNEFLVKHEIMLHPTKGYRVVSVKRSLAEGMTGLLKRGGRLGGTQKMKEGLVNA